MELYKKKDIETLCGLPYRMVQFYVDRRIVIPCGGGGGRGRGWIFGDINIKQLKTINCLYRSGITVSVIETFMKSNNSLDVLEQRAKNIYNLIHAINGD